MVFNVCSGWLVCSDVNKCVLLQQVGSELIILACLCHVLDGL